MKLHFTVRVDTHELVAMGISTDDKHDVEALPGLVEKAERGVQVAKVYGDGAYGSSRVYGFLEWCGVDAVINVWLVLPVTIRASNPFSFIFSRTSLKRRSRSFSEKGNLIGIFIALGFYSIHFDSSKSPTAIPPACASIGPDTCVM